MKKLLFFFCGFLSFLFSCNKDDIYLDKKVFLTDSVFYYKFDEVGDSTISKKEYITYDSKGNVLSEIITYPSVEKTEYEYNSDNYLTRSSIYRTNEVSNKLEIFYESSYAYTVNNQLIEEIHINYSYGVAKKKAKYEYLLNDKETTIAEIEYIWDFEREVWVESYKKEYILNEKQECINSNSFSWNSASDNWRESTKEKYIRDGEGRIIETIVSQQNSDRTGWIITYVEKIKYDSFGKENFYSSEGGMGGPLTITKTYNENGDIVEIKKDDYGTLDVEQFTYNENKKLIQWIWSTNYRSSEMYVVEISNYFYNSEGAITYLLRKKYDKLFSSAIFYQSEYSFSSQNKSKQIQLNEYLQPDLFVITPSDPSLERSGNEGFADSRL